jgi:hypothetical protein
MESLFLWPAMPFYPTGNQQLDLELIPKHFKNITQQINDLP